MVAAFAVVRHYCIRLVRIEKHILRSHLGLHSIRRPSLSIHSSSFRFNQKMSSTEGNKPPTADGAIAKEEDVPKTASQLKKEAKRLAKLEKFNKKQEQSKQAKPKEVKNIIF